MLELILSYILQKIYQGYVSLFCVAHCTITVLWIYDNTACYWYLSYLFIYFI
jgi:hypothetical protein